tara:strand:- start:6153 stop:6821 length:669 start_codon:yes stop_codon:yes gene_type:complete
MNNLQKRIFTSFILSVVLLIALFLNKYSWLILLIIASIICFFEFNNIAKKIWKRKKTFIYFANLISFFYLIFFTYAAFNFSKIEEYILYVLLVCIFSDIGGYVIGKSIGGKKLTKLSPNKTVSGTLGSFVFSLAPLILLLIIYFEEMNININISITELFFITLVLSFICQSGDLFISYFKRKAKVKDTGSILPGHGGLLDRIDGIIFAVPTAFILEKILFYL